jgi:PAS domain S-box-containing protein
MTDTNQRDHHHKTSAWSNLQSLLCKGPEHLRSSKADADTMHRMLLEGDRLFHAMMDAFDGMIYICSMDYRITYLNDRMIEHIGHDATGELCYNAFGRSTSCPWCINHRVLRGETISWEVISPRDGRWYYVVNAPIRHTDGRISKYAMMMDIHERKLNEEELRLHRDNLEESVKERTAELTSANKQLRLEIEERKAAEENLRHSEAKYRELVQNANSMIVRFDTYSRITFFNEYAQKFFGYTEEEIVGRKITETLIPAVDSDGRDIHGRLKDLFTQPEKYKNIALENVRKNGERVVVAWTNRPIRGAEGKIIEFLSVGVDMTERRQARRMIQTLTHELIKAQENERYKIARDLHDHIAQDLSSLKIGLQTIFNGQLSDSPISREQADNLLNILQRSISEVRNLAYDLRPPGLDQFGLVRTLYTYCEDFSQNNAIKIDFIAAGLDDLHLEADIQINLYRLIQEALYNVKKHADAKGVTIRLVASSPSLMLRIIDDGHGFDVGQWRAKSHKEKRMGLQSMVERVGLLNGTIDIRSHQQKGTAIFITIPIKEQDRDRENPNSDH